MERPSILIVDDEKVSLELLSKLVAKLNYNVVQAMNGNDALAAMEKEKISLVISDYDMPDMDGIQLLKLIKTDFPEVPFILVTAHSNTQVLREAWESGAFDYFQKPVFVDRLNQAIRLATEFKHAVVTRRKFPKMEEQAPEPDLLNLGVIRELALALDVEDVLKLVEEFEVYARMELEQVLRLNLAEQSNDVRFLAHRLAGSSVNLGMVKFEHLMREIEDNPVKEIQDGVLLQQTLERSVYWVKHCVAQVFKSQAG